MFKNFNKSELERLVNNTWTFISFLFIFYGASLIHIGLLWIFLGIYVLKNLYAENGIFNIFISIPPNISITNDDEEEYEDEEESTDSNLDEKND